MRTSRTMRSTDLTTPYYPALRTRGRPWMVLSGRERPGFPTSGLAVLRAIRTPVGARTKEDVASSHTVMMWIVRLALRRPYTFTVGAIMIVILGIVTIFRMSTDIFPSIDIPVVSVIWSYAGVAPEEMEKRFVTVTERAMTTTVNNIEHIESQSYNGVAVIKVYFHEGAKVELGVAQVTSIVQTLLRTMPPST